MWGNLGFAQKQSELVTKPRWAKWANMGEADVLTAKEQRIVHEKG